MAITHKAIRKVDGKEAFLLWVETGSTTKAAQVFANRGLVNPRTGRPFSQMTVWNNASKWVIENPDEARPYYIAEGAMLDDETWYVFLVKTAKKVLYSRKKYIGWAKKLGIFESHFWQFADHFGLTEEDLEYYSVNPVELKRA